MNKIIQSNLKKKNLFAFLIIKENDEEIFLNFFHINLYFEKFSQQNIAEILQFQVKYIYELLKKINSLEQFHYEEIVEERFLSMICGYSICPNELIEVKQIVFTVKIIVNF